MVASYCIVNGSHSHRSWVVELIVTSLADVFLQIIAEQKKTERINAQVREVKEQESAQKAFLCHLLWENAGSSDSADDRALEQV